jgi:hypothetical protein
MTSEKIQNIVNDELNGLNTIVGFSNRHGVNYNNIKEFLVLPYEKDFFNTASNLIEKFWVVFDENKNSSKDGYLIFYSEHEHSFGLGTKTTYLTEKKNTGGLVGIYGSFIDAINSM